MRLAKAHRIGIDDFDAGASVGPQALPVAVANAIGEERQIAAEIEDARQPGSDDEIADRRVVGASGDEHGLDRLLHAREVREQARREARALARTQVAPVGPGAEVEPHLELVVAAGRERWGGGAVEDRGCGQPRRRRPLAGDGVALPAVEGPPPGAIGRWNEPATLVRRAEIIVAAGGRLRSR